MTTIHEVSLSGLVFVETAPNTGTITWTNQTNFVSNVSVSRGGNVGVIGIVDTSPGTGTITLVDHSGTIGVGYWVRIRNSGGNVWAGYVSDIMTNVEYRNGVRYEFKTLVVADYVGWLGQFIMPDARGATADGSSGVGAAYDWQTRLNYIHYVMNGNTFNTDANYEAFISSATYGSPTVYGLANHNDATSVVDLLDLTANSVPGRWNATKVSPTSNTNGRVGIANFFVGAAPSSGVKFSDGTHTSGTGFLSYTGIEVSQETNAVVNNIKATNTGQYALIAEEYPLTKFIANPNISRLIPEQIITTSYETTNATSVAAYNYRNGSVIFNHPNSANSAINANAQIEARNLCRNPNFENGGDGWSLGDRTQFRAAIRRPSEDPLAGFIAKNGQNAHRIRVTVANATVDARYIEDSTDGITVIQPSAGLTRTYTMNAWAARSTTPTNARAWGRIVWKDKDDATLSSVDGTKVTLTTAGTWYKITVGGAIPVNAVKAEFRIFYDRADGTNLAVGTLLWADQVTIWASGAGGYTDLDFDGNTPSTDSLQYFWLGAPNASQSVMRTNTVGARALEIMNANSTPYKAPKRLIWNAQNDLTKADDLDLNKTVEIWFEGKKWTSVVSGIRHDISPRRWIVTLELEPSLGV